MNDKIGLVTGFIMGGIGFLFGHNEATNIVYFLLGALGFDLVTGILKSGKNKNITSERWTNGFIRKIGVLMCVSFCYFIDSSNVFNIGISLESGSALFFATGEIISIFENFGEMGVQTPAVVTTFLEKLNGGNNNGQ